MLERRAVVGGAAVTEEFHPGFRNSVAAYTVSLLNPKVIRELELAAHGLRVVERRLSNFLPTDDGRYLCSRRRPHRRRGRQVLASAMRSGSTPTAHRLDRIADVLRELVLQTPPNVVAGGWRQALPELLRAARVGGRIAQARHAAAPRAAAAVRALPPATTWTAGSRAIRSRPSTASTASSATTPAPTRPGSAYVLLHHVFGEVNGKKGAWGHAIGGMGAITQAMARSARARGVDIRVGARCAKCWSSAAARSARSPKAARHSAPGRDLQPQSEAAVPATARRRACCRRIFASASSTGAAARARSA